MKIRFIFFFCAVFLFTTQSWGQNQQSAPYLHLETTGGEQFDILFVNSEINIQDGLFVVKTPSQQFKFNYDEVDNFSFKLKNVSSIKKVLSSSTEVYLDGAGLLHISGNQSLGDISIYGIAGQLLKNVVTNNTEITIDISGFSKGTYLVKTYEGTVKIIK